MLIHDDMDQIDKGRSIDIMLPPQFYTMRRQEINIKYLYQAKRLAPSILENLLSDEVEYDYFVFRDGESWVFVAYSRAEINEFLKSKGIEATQVSKLYFIQQSESKFVSAISLNDTEALGVLNDIVTVIPKTLLSYDTRYQLFDETFRPDRGVSYGASADSVLTQKDSVVLASIFTLFSIMFLIEGIRYGEVVKDMDEEKSILFKEYPALQSQYARENIIKKYHKIDKEERKKREILKDLSHLILPGVEVDSLLMEEGQLFVVFKTPDKNTLLRVEALAKAKSYKSSRVGRENMIKVESKL
ncbi:hypothetical protein MNB_SV-6-701 [hydrothermal vent metagenome]|uniref:Uncharacterized protein n=1 Tax=hydrothermal vent metagenome TaxID=652676 RepID=A0A1W1BUL7_9ZZZZ